MTVSRAARVAEVCSGEQPGAGARLRSGREAKKNVSGCFNRECKFNLTRQ